jgi:Aspartyl protease
MDAVPFEMPSTQVPFVVMEARVSDRETARVLLDTGNGTAFTLLISPELAARSGATLGRTHKLPGAVGAAAVEIRETRLSAFDLGPVRLRDVRAGVSEALTAVSAQLGRPIDAVVGHEFVRGRIVSIDYPARRVDFAAAAGPEAEAEPFTLAPRRPLTLVRVRLNGRGPYLLALDSAASTTLLSPKTAISAGIDATQAATLGGAGGASAGGARLGRARIGLGPLERESNVAVADVLEPIREAAGAAIDGVLGADFLSASRVTFDYAGNRLWILPSLEEGE